MGVTTAARWSQNLIEAGKAPTTPVAIVRRCSWHDQQVVTCQLAEVAQRLTPASAFRPPVLTIVGNVAQFYPQLDWFMQRPLFGTTILVTRPRQQAESLTQQLEELGAEVIHYAAIHIEPVQDFTQLDAILHSQGSGSEKKPKPEPQSSIASQPYDWIIFSSRNGVDAFFSRLHELQYDARQLGQAKIAAVGPGTAAALATWHVTCQCTPDSQYGADALADKLVQQVAGQRCLIVTGSRSRDTLAERLKQSSATVDVVVVYRNVDETIVDERLLQRMQRGEVHYTTVTSSSIAKSVVNLFGDALLHTRLISISPLTSSTLRELGFKPFQEASEASVADLIPSWNLE
jgi:uroporphyrinogen III methyltransferase/synthase